jgi:hypothetical protein
LPGHSREQTATRAADSCTQQGLAEFVPGNAPARLAFQNYGGKSGTRH